MDQEFFSFWTLESDIGGSFIADGAESPQVARIVFAAKGFIDDMAQMESSPTTCVLGVRLAGNSSTHLAGKTITIQYEGACFL